MEAEKYFEQIEAYLRGELPAAEADALRAEAAENPELKAMLLRHRLADRAIELAQDDDLREKMQAVRQQYGPLPKPATQVIALRRVMARAAAILILVVAGLGGFAYLNYSDNALLGAYYEPAASPDVSRGGADTEQWFAQGIYLYYQEKDYAGALQSFVAVAPESENYLAAHYLAAHCQLQIGQALEALAAFDQMLAQGTIPGFVEREEVEWNRMLCLLSLDRDEEAGQVLQTILAGASYSSQLKSRAGELERKMNSFWRGIWP